MTTHEDVKTTKQDSTIDALPYYPRLCRLLGGVTISIVLCYLEIHHSPPEPDPAALPARAGLRNPPAMLDCDQACEDLGVSRGTLDTALQSLGVWWKHEAARSAAARCSREFLNSGRSFPRSSYVTVKPYAIVGSRQWNGPRTLAIHRNQQRLDQIATATGLLGPSKCASSSDTGNSASSLDIAAKMLEIGPIPRGLAWGWSEERRKAASERMTAKWLKWRELGPK